jgi:LuxR family transcriptional regulator, maltose regulon positive regulatory protein
LALRTPAGMLLSMATATVESVPRAAIGSGHRLVPRTQLVGRLLAARDMPLVLLVAPAGYGKTTVVSEWELQDSRPFAWVALREADNDPAHLRRSIAAALRRAPDHDDEGIVLVLDGAEVLTSPQSMDALVGLLEQHSEGGQLVLASRTEPALGVGALRAQRKLLELRAGDLAMAPVEAADLLHAQGFELDRRDLERLVARTEGWPAALYLAALAARGSHHPARALAGFAGDDRYVADYLAEELLAGCSEDELSFLIRTSVLDRLTGPVCDRLLERGDSAQMLKALSRSNLLLVPLDRCDTEFRYHRLLAEALRGELRRLEPDEEEPLHLRASSWFDEHDNPERAISHAIAAGDPALAGRLIWAHAPEMLGQARGRTLARWLSSFSETQIGASAELSLAAAASALFTGDRTLVECWTSAVMHGAGDASPALRAHALLLRASVAEDSIAAMGAGAEAACADIPEDSPWFALGQLVQGVAHHLTGDREAARRVLESGARHAAAGFPGIQALCLAQLCLLAIERGDWPSAESLSARAKRQVERSGLGDCPLSALAYAVSADVLAHVGRVEAAQADTRTAGSLLARLVDFSPWYEAEARIALGRSALRLSDLPHARKLLADATTALSRSPDAKVAVGWAKASDRQAHDSVSASPGGWCLTTAELRVLQFLPTHLSFPEVAERLFVSANTVKTHARSVYRKLGASSRGEAVQIARRSGLLDEASYAGIRHSTPYAISPDPSDVPECDAA